ncbi:hypothetical protein [Parageobacillus thermoglucosidasius]|jgi:hypothetical protein|uniref:Uncharacterized protein n=1 Tax=Parageobacillus thermoglucosidasius TaxID=1426 RepID=A0A1B7KRJ6_PARTM|nr:hypothetical protein [Parageobacillus thermoglucosidasius]OAT72696.1 hypothetical protein A7K69_07055 [Parageobacillus thermoglucosidasius]
MAAPSNTNTVTKDTFSPNNERVNQLLQRLSKVNWLASFAKKGDEQVEQAIKEFAHYFRLEHCQVKWMTEDELPSFFTEMKLKDSDVWLQLRQMPEKIKRQAEQAGKLDALLTLADEVPALIFHHCFDKLFAALEQYGSPTVTTAVCYMMYIGGMACAWELVSHIKGWETNPFLSLIAVLEHGHWPLGLIGNQFYVI